MKKKLTVILMLISLFFSGCLPLVFIGGAAIGVGGYKYYNGALVVIYQTSFDKTWNASVAAMEKMGYEIYERNRKIASGKMVTTGKSTESIKLTIKYVSLEETEVKIRVGLMGDEGVSNKIKDKISELAFGTVTE